MFKTFPLAIFLIFLICPFNMGQNLRKTQNFKDPISSLAELDNNHFGNALMSAMAVHLSTNSPIEEIVSLLNTLKENLAKDQEKADAKNNTEQKQCEKSFNEFQINIDYHNQELENEENYEANNQQLLTRCEKNYKEIVKDLNENTERYEDSEKTRSQQHINYLQRSKDFEEALEALDEANSLLQHLKSGSALIQMKKKLEKVKEKLTQNSMFHTNLYNPLISSLTEIAINADQESVKKIIVLLMELRETLSTSKNNLEENENQQVENWEKIKNDLQNEKKNLISKKSDTEDEIENYRKLIQVSEEKIKYHQKELETTKTLLENTQTYCINRGAEYERISQERQLEMEILERLFVNFDEKLGNLKDYLKNRVNYDF